MIAASALLDRASGTGTQGCHRSDAGCVRSELDAMAADALSDLLKTVRLTGAAYLRHCGARSHGPCVAAARSDPAEDPAGCRSPDCLSCGDGGPLLCHARRRTADCAGGRRSRCVHQQRPSRHVEQPGAACRSADADVFDIAAAGRMPFHINFGDGAGSASLVCGYLACDAQPFNPLLEAFRR